MRSDLPLLNGTPSKWVVPCPRCYQSTALFLVIRDKRKTYACQCCNREISETDAQRGRFEAASESDRTLDYLFLNNPIVNRAMRQAGVEGKSWREAIVLALKALADVNDKMIKTIIDREKEIIRVPVPAPQVPYPHTYGTTIHKDGPPKP